MHCTPFGICLGAPLGIAPVGYWTGTGFLRSIMQYMHMIYMYRYKRYVGDIDTCICYIALVQNPVSFHLAFASARLVALRRLVAGWALDFAVELCSICICIYMYLYNRYVGTCFQEDPSHWWDLGLLTQAEAGVMDWLDKGSGKGLDNCRSQALQGL